jgi:hypothetical protein
MDSKQLRPLSKTFSLSIPSDANYFNMGAIWASSWDKLSKNKSMNIGAYFSVGVLTTN